MFEIQLIGIAPGDQLGATEREIISRCSCVVASSRHRSLVDDCGIEIIPIAPVAEAIATIESRLVEMDVAVLASGDPLFFGIGRTLLDKFGPERVSIHPALSSLQFACACFREPWDDVSVVSLHGREAVGLAAKVMAHDKVFCFTDRVNSPDMVSQSVRDACAGINAFDLAADYTVWVGENLGQDDERITKGTLPEIAEAKFADLNVMLLKRPQLESVNEVVFGLGEEEIDHSRGLITKDEVRAASLHQLRLPSRGVLWDVGAGSGSVGLEAARLCPELQVYAVERNLEELANIRANCRKFGVYNLTVIEGAAPAALEGLPNPDRVFVGGSGGNLAGIIEFAAARLPKGGRLLVNGVIEKTKNDAPLLLHEQGLKVTISEIAIQRRNFPENSEKTMNPIAMMVGEK